jgi:virginiamycin B lyase
VSTPSPTLGATPTLAPSPGESPGRTAEATPVDPSAPGVSDYVFEEFAVPAGSHPHDVAPAPDGFVWYTAQAAGKAGRLDPVSGEVTQVDLGPGSAPHGIIAADDGSIWITDQGLNAVLRVDPGTLEVERFDMPGYRTPDVINASPHTPAIDLDGRIWFSGATGYVGQLDPRSGDVLVWAAPEGTGPYGIDVAPDGFIWFVSLDQSYLARVHPASGEIEIFEPPTANQGARRVWADSLGRLWLTEWNAGKLAMYDPASGEWREWPMPGPGSQPYAIYVDELDLVWITDFGTNELVRFNPATETFDAFEWPTPNAAVRQLLGRAGEVWGAESATDKIVVLRW